MHVDKFGALRVFAVRLSGSSKQLRLSFQEKTEPRNTRITRNRDGGSGVMNRSDYVNKDGASFAFAGGVNPKCSYAKRVAKRPRGVRLRNPICRR